jgi:pyridoxal phosphate enzyme (YggS family)
MATVQENMHAILCNLPPGVQLVVVGKGRLSHELQAAIDSGALIIGENYLQDAETVRAAIEEQVQWHFIGHLQKNKVKKAVELFDMVETVDSIELAAEIDKRCSPIGKVMPILIEVNSGREPDKSGAFPEDAIGLVTAISRLSHLRLMGLMTMGPVVSKPEDIRPFFALTHELFNDIKRLNISNVEMKYLSMGMSDSYRIAIEEGANLVRIGTGIFAP